MNLNKYLEQIQNADESIFPMDSLHTKKEPLRTVYPEQDVLTNEEKIMIDFDGVIHSYHDGWQGGEIYGYVLKGAREAINNLKEKYRIIIFTSRLSKENIDFEKQKILVEEWLQRNDIYYDDITAEKFPAKFYIDDKAVWFRSWEQTLKNISERE